MNRTVAGSGQIVTVTLTQEQYAQFKALKERTNTVTDGAMVKKALEYYIEWLGSDER
jgi:hypothetical protein